MAFEKNDDFVHKRGEGGGKNLTTVLFTSDIDDNFAWPLKEMRVPDLHVQNGQT